MSPPDPIPATPLRIGTVSLVVRDLARMADFYREVIGLAEIGRDGATVQLGAGPRAFLALTEDRSAPLSGRRSAGLFHTAFLLPDRASLGRWLRHAADLRAPLQGASDHGVSEAIYLADPEGNGIEVYADRAGAEWPREGGALQMVSDPLDMQALLAAGAGGTFAGAPMGTTVGHVHLQVGDVAESERFYATALGLDVMQHMPSATFLSSGGYHHHVAGNIWNSRGARPRDPAATGLKGFELLARDEAAFGAAEAAILASGATAAREREAIHLTDPAGVGITLKRG
ncbi:VOC family protein [Aureimonas phyllosphaerae]|uniref:Catechol 2,3-dioxygenase n=1 Tax=Aureimonas phyllosphaerae TaxID=1166078 RepID=A0A7W6C044_9HYPH|nr:VOC family protein [Aureimonas phyllosphaerae]MBB3935937.1 catechol 2,3-dioxygenase [Aureimonas phyllosphaerae]MBB3960338.1 catechol 2,3-dioxygenase [Aureimonas phyllosphaerae]SFF36626.1 catechol 2,3-dioxygenase [Aureimonas phyllosphaerae]